jgi:hypothetical protein
MNFQVQVLKQGQVTARSAVGLGKALDLDEGGSGGAE